MIFPSKRQLIRSDSANFAERPERSIRFLVHLRLWIGLHAPKSLVNVDPTPGRTKPSLATSWDKFMPPKEGFRVICDRLEL